MSKTTVPSGGVGFFPLMCLMFMGLKLGSVITWSWLWVFAPMWIPLALSAVCLAIYLLVK